MAIGSGLLVAASTEYSMNPTDSVLLSTRTSDEDEKVKKSQQASTDKITSSLKIRVKW